MLLQGQQGRYRLDQRLSNSLECLLAKTPAHKNSQVSHRRSSHFRKKIRGACALAPPAQMIAGTTGQSLKVPKIKAVWQGDEPITIDDEAATMFGSGFLQ
jgi:hypothetical protein